MYFHLSTYVLISVKITTKYLLQDWWQNDRPEYDPIKPYIPESLVKCSANWEIWSYESDRHNTPPSIILDLKDQHPRFIPLAWSSQFQGLDAAPNLTVWEKDDKQDWDSSIYTYWIFIQVIHQLSYLHGACG